MVKVVYKDLSKSEYFPNLKLDGLAHTDTDKIEIEKTLRGALKLETLIHEAYHIAKPKASEKETLRVSKLITGVLVKAGYRKSSKSYKY